MSGFGPAPFGPGLPGSLSGDIFVDGYSGSGGVVRFYPDRIHHTTYFPDANARLSYDRDWQGNYIEGSHHGYDQTARKPF